MQKRVLVMDVGNTRMKWALVESAAESLKWLDGGASELGREEQVLARWDHLPAPDKIIGSNVAGEAKVAGLAKYWQARGQQIYWIQSAQSRCGVTNHYHQPAQLGSDRWAALVGAWRKARQSCLVVSAGTAMTIDMLDNEGGFIGGLIFPGKRLMQESLISGTHALQDITGRVGEYPLDTADGMSSGIALALASSIESVFSRLQSHCNNKPVCMLTGGDAHWLAGMLRINCRVEPKLVLEGLLCLAEEENCK